MQGRQMRIISKTGTRDSGKTTLIKSLFTLKKKKKKRCAIIVNEDGKEGYEDEFIKRLQISIDYLRGG